MNHAPAGQGAPDSSRAERAITSKPSEGRGETGQINREQGLLTMTMLAKWAETSAYTPPEEPTTGAVMSATDTAKEPGTERVKTIKNVGLTVQPSPGPCLLPLEQNYSTTGSISSPFDHAASCRGGGDEPLPPFNSLVLLMGNQDSKEKSDWPQEGLIPKPPQGTESVHSG